MKFVRLLLGSYRISRWWLSFVGIAYIIVKEIFLKRKVGI